MKKHLRDWRATAGTISTLCFVVSGCQDASSPAANVLAASSSTAKQEFPDDGVSIASNSWMALPSLVTPRMGHAAVSFGGCVWAIGGRGGGSVHSSVERYCPSIDATRWSAAAPLPEARADFAGVGVIANRIYAAGGMDASGGPRRSLFFYSAATGWSVSSDSLPFPMACGGGGAVVGGKLYVYAGDTIPAGTPCDVGHTLMVYDPAKSAPPRWTILPAPPADASWQCFFAMAAVRNFLHFVGGYGCNWIDPTVLQYSYNTSTAQWVPAPKLPVTIWPAALAISGRLLIFGGHDAAGLYDTTYETWSYDPATAAAEALSPMRIGRTSHAAAALGNKIVIVGGFETAGGETGKAEQLTIVTGCDIHEPDATRATANAWRMFDELFIIEPFTQAKICSTTDVDNFRLVYSGLLINFGIRMSPPAGKDYELLLLDPTGKVVERSSLVGSVPETVSVPYNYDGYFVRVRSQDGTFSASAPYRLEVVP
ncbi:MAG: kelch repeat-containing protein [Gemmatimonadaceae bacterium]|nr:kelch repeat-containing protein [Gemmatimonadaceae bacterium]